LKAERAVSAAIAAPGLIKKSPFRKGKAGRFAALFRFLHQLGHDKDREQDNP